MVAKKYISIFKQKDKKKQKYFQKKSLLKL